tara:strand:+ start:4912 stop:5934 length:1023 start_codon:yes stop_codon:yes gene_type:complete
MVATYTDNLRLTKQGDNDNPNTWGNVVNVQVIELIEKAISGAANIDVTGGADVTLTSLNGTDDQSRNMILELTGVTSGDINLIVPSVEKVYIINATHTGGFKVKIKPAGGGTTVDFELNDFGVIYTNGTNIYNITKGAMFQSNNLSDVLDVPTARTNLGLGDLSVLGAGTGLTINGANLDVDSQSSVAVGDYKFSAGVTTSGGWYLCNGQELDKTVHAALFALIGIIYGSGNGTTTFNVPDPQGRALIASGTGDTAEGGTTGTARVLGASGGAETHTLTIAEMPAHTHEGTKLQVKNIDTPQQNENISDGSTTTGSTGGDGDHENMSPFFVGNLWIYSGA